MREPGPADGTRRVVIAHPFDASGGKANRWEVLDLSPTGELSRPGRTFTMGRASLGELAFTRDGAIGVAAQEDGSLGIFSLDDAGVPTVLQATYKGSFYAARVVTSPAGTIYVLDDQWRENGGGIYELSIDCDNTVSDRLVAASKLPAALRWLDNDRAVLAANDIASSPAGAEAHVLAWSEAPSLVASADAFTDDMAIIGGATLSHDGAFFFIGDTSSFGSVPNRVAVVPVTGDSLGSAMMIPDVEDPLALLAAPDADVVLAVSGFGDAMFVLDRNAGTWRKKGEVAYVGAKPQLPSGAVMVERGSLAGLALVAENLGVRPVKLGATVVDRGVFSLGDGLTNSVGAIGVTP